MAREIVAWCDIEMANDERVEARTYTIALDGGPREIDLCDEHRKALIDPLRDVLASHGSIVRQDGVAAATRRQSAAVAANTPQALAERAARGSRRGTAPAGERSHACLFCPLDYASPTSLISHCASAHGFERTSLAVFGRRCPMCGESGWTVLSQHGQHAHDVASVSRLFVAARDAGDPHGVVAERVALASNVIASER